MMMFAMMKKIDAFLARKRWRVADLFKHVDVKGRGFVTGGALRDNLLKWRVEDTKALSREPAR